MWEGENDGGSPSAKGSFPTCFLRSASSLARLPVAGVSEGQSRIAHRRSQCCIPFHGALRPRGCRAFPWERRVLSGVRDPRMSVGLLGRAGEGAPLGGRVDLHLGSSLIVGSLPPYSGGPVSRLLRDSRGLLGPSAVLLPELFQEKVQLGVRHPLPPEPRPTLRCCRPLGAVLRACPLPFGSRGIGLRALSGVPR